MNAKPILAVVALTLNGQPLSRAGDVDAVPILQAERTYTPFPDGRVLEVTPSGCQMWYPAPGGSGLMFTF